MKVSLISVDPDVWAVGTKILSSVLKKQGHKVQIVLLMVKSSSDEYHDNALDELAELVKDSDLIGISLMSISLQRAVQVTLRLKREFSIPIVWGGIHPTMFPEESLQYADMICRGEGEIALPELINKMKSGQEYIDTKGMWFKRGEEIIENDMLPLIQDLDSVPYIDNDYGTHFVLHEGHLCRMNPDLLDQYSDGRYLSYATRGCPFECTYCYNAAINSMYPGQKIVRKRSVDNIINEFSEIKNRFPILTRFMLADDCFTMLPEETIRKFCTKYKEKIGMPLSIPGASPSTLNREKLDMLVDAGTFSIKMGIQTGSERTKRLFKRKFSNEHILEVAKIINEYKDKIQFPVYDLIVDNPYETDEDVIDTLMFMSKLPVPFYINLHSLFLFPGTPLYERVKQDGRLDEFTRNFRSEEITGSFEVTYWNKLFKLIHAYAVRSKKISPFIMSLLTNKIMRSTKLSHLLYIVLKLNLLSYLVWNVITGPSPLGKVKGNLSNVLGDLRAGKVPSLFKQF